MVHVTPTLWEPVRPFSRALVIIAHPDDAEFGAAGTVARWVDAGTAVVYLVVTDGASGSADPQMTRERLVAIRVEEQRAACAKLGVTDVAYLGDLVLHSINPAASTRLWDPMPIDEGLEPWDVAELWLMGFGEGQDRVNVTMTFDRKLAALRAHASQLDGWDPEPLLREWAGGLGKDVGVELAEPFTVLRFRDLDDEQGQGR